MNFSISKSEKLDIFLALATFYKFETKAEIQSNKSVVNQIDLALNSLSAMDDKELEILRERAKKLRNLSEEKQQLWQTFWLEKLRNRGLTSRLDENIHPEHIAEILLAEPLSVRTLIYEKLPKPLAKLITEIFAKDNKNIAEIISIDKGRKMIPDKISRVIREKFLSNFVSFENIYKPNAVDKLTAEKLQMFIWKLGVRETAISCRGIKTKENLAVFLKPFDEIVTKEIAIKITELEEINPLRVLRSETIVAEVFENIEDSDEKLTHLGLELLAICLIMRDETAKQFTIQKLPIVQSEKLKGFIDEYEAKYSQSDNQKREIFEELGREVLELAEDFVE